MQLTSYTDYSLRVLMYLGVKGKQLSSISEIAKQYNISRNHLVKVVHKLAQEGFVRSQRGRSGGITLGYPAANNQYRKLVAYYASYCQFLYMVVKV